MYDPDCYELARGFLEDSDVLKHLEASVMEVLRKDLAQRIQDTIDDALSEFESEYKKEAEGHE